MLAEYPHGGYTDAPPSGGVEAGEWWSPVWPPLEDSPQIKYGLLQPYFILEEFVSPYEDHKSYMSFTDHTELMNFFSLLRESRGYDIVSYPCFMLDWGWVNRTLRVLDKDFELPNVHYQEKVYLKMRAVIHKINEEAKCHGEKYTHGRLVNNVRNIEHRLSLLTFTVEQVDDRDTPVGVVKTVQAMVLQVKNPDNYYVYEVEEWRFKPQQHIVHSSDARVVCIGGSSNPESPMDWE